MEVRRASISAGYFATMKIPLLEGRDFTIQDNEDAPRVAIVDETMAHHFWPGQYAIGKRVRIHDNWVTVVGVAKNSSHQSVHEAPEPLVYLSIFQTSYLDTIIQLRARGDVAMRAPEVERAVHELNAKLAVFDERTLEQSTRMASMFEMAETTFASAFGVLALILAASGIYGVMAYRTALRTHEIGIRVALGASRSDVLMLVMRQGLKLASAGIVLGLSMSLVLTRLVRGLLYGVTAMDPVTVLAGTLVLLAIALAAIYLPALKAMRTDPVDAIRAH
jgi:predicted permease